ncbi:MAG: alpha/beta hydrolase [Terricaulis sp.]
MRITNILISIGLWIVRILGWLLLALCVFIIWAAFLSTSNEGQLIAQLLFTAFALHITLITAISTGMALRQYLKRKSATAAGATLISGATTALGLYLIAGFIGVANAQHVPVHFLEALAPQFTTKAGADEAAVYDTYQGENASLYVFKPPQHASAQRPPVFVYVHGGGYTGGAANWRAPDMRWFANQGYLVIGVDYALSSATRHMWDVTQPQVGCALAWLSRNADRLGADVNRIVLFGDSAGGNIVLNVASLARNGKLASHCGGAVPSVAATIALYPPMDLTNLYARVSTRNLLDAYLGGSPEQYPERYTSLSPNRAANLPTPPALLMLGETDSTVPPADGVKYVAQLRAAHNSAELVTIPHGGHGFDLGTGAIGNQIMRERSLAFLRAHQLSP